MQFSHLSGMDMIVFLSPGGYSFIAKRMVSLIRIPNQNWKKIIRNCTWQPTL